MTLPNGAAWFILCETEAEEVPDVVIITVFRTPVSKTGKQAKGRNEHMIDNPIDCTQDEHFAVGTNPIENGENPPLILGKFKDYSELEKAYCESERFISRTREELKEARELLAEATVSDVEEKFQSDLEGFLQEHGLADRAYDFISYLEENPELLSLDHQAAFTMAKRALTTLPSAYREYAHSLSQMPPALICGQGGEFCTTPGNQPKTFEEAGEMFLQMVKH